MERLIDGGRGRADVPSHPGADHEKSEFDLFFFFRFIGPVLRKKKYSTKSNGNPVRQKLGKTRQAINQTVETIYATTGR